MFMIRIKLQENCLAVRVSAASQKMFTETGD